MHRPKQWNVYRKSLILTKEIRTLTKNFPKNEVFVLASQFKRDGDFIALNIAEGAGNVSPSLFTQEHRSALMK